MQNIQELTPNDQSRLRHLDPVIIQFVRLAHATDAPVSLTPQYISHILGVAQGMSPKGVSTLLGAIDLAFRMDFAFTPNAYVSRVAKQYAEGVVGDMEIEAERAEKKAAEATP